MLGFSGDTGSQYSNGDGISRIRDIWEMTTFPMCKLYVSMVNAIHVYQKTKIKYKGFDDLAAVVWTY